MILAVFVPLVLYYVMFKMALALDKHVQHKKEIYFSLENEIPHEIKDELKSFPTNALSYYWIFITSGAVVFVVDLYFPINIENLFIPTPTLLALIVNFFFLVVLSDVISKRLYAHQELENEVNTYFTDEISNVNSFKKRSGLGFMMLSFISLGVYVYIYLFLVNKEYTTHVITDYANVKKILAKRA